MSLPARVRVGPIDYAVKLVPRLAGDGKSLDGRCHNEKATIEIRAELGPQQQMQVLWHEIVHAIGYQAQILRLKVDSERAVDALAWGIMQVVRDNPGLAKGGR